MCIFTKSVALVANTRIFARSGAAGRQVLAYGMTMDAIADLAMILPLPIESGIGELDVKFIDLSDCADFFEILQANVIFRGNPGRSRGVSKGTPITPIKPTLLVRNVGSFEASFAPTREDLDRLDSRFRLDPAVWQKLVIYQDFGFAVFKLRPGLKRVHPMALDFPRRDPKSLFFPTVHVHDGHSVPSLAKFDHELFFQSASEPKMKRIWFTSGTPVRTFMRETPVPSELMDMNKPCYSIRIHGKRVNRDVYVVEDQAGRVKKLR
jgi:hypothetical protein